MSYRYSDIAACARRNGCRYVVALTLVALSTASSQAIQVSATFNDPDNAYTQYYDLLEASLAGAAATWGAHLVVHPDAVIDIEFSFDNIPTAASTPRGHSLVGTFYPALPY